MATKQSVQPIRAESYRQLEALASHFEEAYLQELDRIQRFGGDLAKARRLFRQWHAYREALAAHDRDEWDFTLEQILTAKAA